MGPIKTQSILAKIFIFSKDKQKILLLLNKRGYWDLPGGHQEFEETPEECLMREVQEEIGVDVIIDRLTSIQTVLLNGTEGIKKEIEHYTILIYTGKLLDDAQIIKFNDGSIIDYRWVEIREIKRGLPVKILPLTKEQFLESEEQDITTRKKYYIKKGEIVPYKIIEYKR